MAYIISATLVVSPTLNFVNNPVDFTVTTSLSSVSAYDSASATYEWNVGEDIFTSATSAISYPYNNFGYYDSVSVNISYWLAGSQIDSYTASAGPVKINPVPSIYVSGTPQVNYDLNFQDLNGGNYLTDTISSADWDFGDSNTSAVTSNFDAELIHSYDSTGDYIVNVSAYDVSGNVGTSDDSVIVFASGLCKTKVEYITICGPKQLSRYGSNRLINLTEYLPQTLRGTDTENFLEFFEEFLNEMFDGEDGWATSARNDLTINQAYDSTPPIIPSGDYPRNYTYSLSGENEATDANDVEEIKIEWSPNSISASPKISILEKIHRLTELHDPDLIDIDYIQFFANNLGYDIKVYRNEVGLSGTGTLGIGNFGDNESTTCVSADSDKYLRFVVSSLPHWLKIKSTKNAIKVMLYSFGLVGDLVEYYTKDYVPIVSGGKWSIDYDGNLQAINDKWYPTPHFALRINIDESSDISYDVSRRSKVIRAIESIRPVNTVFQNLSGYVKRIFTVYVGALTRFTRYIKIESDGYSDWWKS